MRSDAPPDAPEPLRVMWAKCGECDHLRAEGCEVWIHLPITAEVDASLCRTFARAPVSPSAILDAGKAALR